MQLPDLIRLIKAVPVDARPKVLALARSLKTRPIPRRAPRETRR